MELQRKRREVPPVETMELVGGRLCLDFVNTLNRERDQVTDERFRKFQDVLDWSVRLGLIDASAATRLGRECNEHPRTAEVALERVRELRETVWRLFSARQAKDLKRIQMATKDLPLPRLELDEKAGVVIEPGRDLCGWLIAAIYGSTLELLALEDPVRIRACPAPRCGWLFLDSSPGNRRKWCSMRTCGNREKAREHYKRARKTAG
jgi:predicted RNA-binding Zn ribbon-like protein